MLLLSLIETIFLILCVLPNYEGRAIMSVLIFDYRNPHNLMHDGRKCETFEFMGDHCDPMFTVCISSNNYNCNILWKKIPHFKNFKNVATVLNMYFVLENFPQSISIKVHADDHDRFDEHDHIATFQTTFRVSRTVREYTNEMSINPWLRNVKLFSKMTIVCASNYYGPECGTFCQPSKYYSCDPSTGEKWFRKCGKNGQYREKGNAIVCVCDEGWSGHLCTVKITTTSTPLFTTRRSESTTKREILKQVTSTTIDKITMTTENIESVSTNQTSLVEEPKVFAARKAAPVHSSSISFATVVIICLLILLCVTVLALLIIMRNWHRRNKDLKTMFMSSSKRPLPPIIDQSTTKPNVLLNYPSATYSAKPTERYIPDSVNMTIESNDTYDYTTPIIRSAKDYINIYENPRLILNTDSMTCETNITTFDEEDDGYMAPKND